LVADADVWAEAQTCLRSKSMQPSDARRSASFLWEWQKQIPHGNDKEEKIHQEKVSRHGEGKV
jgi:hypothetical protein